MNPFLILLILIGAIVLWFLLASLYKPTGKIFTKIFNKSINEIKESEEER